MIRRKQVPLSPDADDAPIPLIGTLWVHAFEEDTPAGAVYRPDGERFPLSRRPRRRLSLHADGSATVADGGADDRLVDRSATWSEVDGEAVIRCRGGVCLRVVDHGPRRLVVRTEPGVGPSSTR